MTETHRRGRSARRNHRESIAGESLGIAAIPRGPIATLWHSEGPEAAWLSGRALLERARPRAVKVHSWSPHLVADSVRRALGRDLSLVVGIGVDGIARDVAKRRLSVTRGVRQFVELARRAHACGAVALEHNAEADYKRPPTSPERALLRELVRGALGEIASRFPKLVQLHTSYDHPSFHSTYPWEAWLGVGSPVVASFAQVYAAPGDGLLAHRGALPKREARSLASWRAAVRAGWISSDNSNTEHLEGVAWRPYYQAHGVNMRDTVASALRHESVALWAIPTRCDRDGRSSLLALCELDRRGLWRADGLEEFQRAAGLVVDGIYGPLTEAALVGAVL